MVATMETPSTPLAGRRLERAFSVSKRFAGPPGCANGGYVAGRIAQHFEVPVETTLNHPVPLERAVQLEWYEDVAMICDGPTVLATVCPGELDLEVPQAPTYSAAVHATRFRLAPHIHPFPDCFVCGPLREEGEGLRIFAGPVDRRDLVAAPWLPDASLAGRDGAVRKEFVFAALDCPGGFAAMQSVGPRPAVLGRFVAHVEKPVVVGERHIIMGWRIRHKGRKHVVGTALFTASGERCGLALATWIEKKESRM